ncbi:ABC transporter substrate-binding protein [Nitratireductor aquibiodomus]|uniref:ABC transporter substrate-binding protein n=1 Tax=Nitratireductor aquibiodomus TaxID=204799 RepID=UPI0019D3FE1C|nr:ABC transporter substrate-binding protein [Nitratireductor aquibiodomus]MBN7762907.1 ABC transporter substrate-binding protein [Nitratireductor aquibiodomus]
MRERRKRLSRLSGLTFLAGALLSAPVSATPERVMSLNLCTDQLAMTLAEPEQLISVSFLAREPDLSMLHEKAQGFPVNRGLAEEVFLEKPDLVVTGTYSLHNTTALLKRLGFRIEEFSFVQTLDTIPGEIRRMGALLGQEARAEKLAEDFSQELDAIAKSQCDMRPTMIAYDQNGVALGSGTLADSVMQAAGFANLAADLGLVGVAPFPLEQVIAARPDVIVTSASEGAPTLGEHVPRHPAIAALPDTRIGAFVPAGAWSCGSPAVIEAVRALASLRAEIAPCPQDATQ